MEKVLEILRGYITEFEEITNIKFDGELRINNRLSKSLGRCKAIGKYNRWTDSIEYIPKIIEISGKAIQSVTEEQLKEITAHEFAHYYTFKYYGKHNHNNVMFREVCNKLNTISAPRANFNIKRKYEVFCECCGKRVGARSSARADLIKYTHHYKSGCCNANLIVVKNY